MDFGLIIIGDEILSGKRADKHLQKAIALLGARGLSVAYAHYVGDDPARITATLARAFQSGDAVFSFGGIGATPDDHTRQCAAKALGVEMALHPQAAALIRERMQDVAREQGLPYDPNREDNVHRLNMGVFPAGAHIIPNPYNKIAGFSCFAALEHEGFTAGPPQGETRPPRGAATRAAVEPRPERERWTHGGIHFFPGFPVMAHPMVEWVLDTYYRSHFQRDHWAERSVIVFGGLEAALTPLMERIEREFPVRVFSLPSVDHPEYGRHIELGVKGAPGDVAAAFAALREGLHQENARLGPELVH